MNSDYFAELFVAGILADEGWNVYFPHRDKGFDFIISKEVNRKEIIRPVQVKGKYPTKAKTDKNVYGYAGRLSKVHPDMILIIPYFNDLRADGADLIAYMPFSKIRRCPNGSFKCEPATYKNQIASPRRDFAKYFNKLGLALLETKGSE